MLLENPHALSQETSSSFATVNEKLILTGAALGGIAYRGYFAERNGATNELPEPLRDIANSMAHPWVGFTAAGVTLALGHAIEERVENERAKQIINRGKYAAAVLVGVAANFAVEKTQDLVVRPRHLFTDPSSRYESTKDLLAAMIGVGIACAIQADLPNKVANKFQAWRAN